MNFTLTPKQKKAINFNDGNLLILACAGSGKTETLARRIVRLIIDGESRRSIVAFTFTDHAATELKYRIRQRLHENMPSEPSLGDMYVGTIHSYCLKILRERQQKFRRFEVMDETQQAALVATNFYYHEDNGRGIGLDKLRTRTRTKTFSETLQRFLNTLNILHQQKINIATVDDKSLSNAIQNYAKVSQEFPNFFLDFNQIIDKMLTFLDENPEELKGIQENLSHLFVDEYQDIDQCQEQLIALLTNNGRDAKLTVVGDDDQSLYKFRGANITNILTFKDRYPNVKQIQLNDNFRSTHAIVEIADEAVRKISNRIPKEPVAKRFLAGNAMEEHMASHGDIQLREFSTEKDEATWVAERIKALHGTCFEEKDGNTRGLDYGDMAILLRSVRGTGAQFAETLRREGIPVVISGMGGLFNNDEIQLVQASFCLLARSEFYLQDEKRRLNTIETRQFIREKIQTLRKTNRIGPHSNSTQYLSWIDKQLEDLAQRSLTKEERDPRKSARIYPQAIFREMLRTLGILVDEKKAWPDDLMFNLGAFSNLLTQYESVHQWITPARLKGLNLFLSIWGARHVDEGGIQENAAMNSVRIMTVHSAKGLEWPVVFLPRVLSRTFPSSRRNQAPDTFLPKDLYAKVLKEYIGGDEAERRLWYVALTRCEKHLNISTLDRRYTKPSPYFKEISHILVSRDESGVPQYTPAPPQPSAQAAQIRVTYSDLEAFWRCEREYQLRALMNFSPGVGEQFGYGRQVHNILAEIHQRAIDNNPLNVSEIREFVTSRFHLRYTAGQPAKAMLEAAIMGIEKYVKKFRNDILKTYAAEKSFELFDQDVDALIHGTVDLLDYGDRDTPPSQRKITGLIEFKTERIETEDEFKKILEKIQDQIQLYAVGVEYAYSEGPDNAAAHIISPTDQIEKFADSPRIPIDISPQARENVIKKIRKAITKIKENMNSGNYGQTGVTLGNCLRCDFRNFCSGYNKFKSASELSIINSTPEEDQKEEVDQIIESIHARPSSK